MTRNLAKRKTDKEEPYEEDRNTHTHYVNYGTGNVSSFLKVKSYLLEDKCQVFPWRSDHVNESLLVKPGSI